MPHDEIDEVAAELYALPPDAFTAARNARAAAAGGEAGRRIKALRKPTVAAWAVDLLSREGDLGEALELDADGLLRGHIAEGATVGHQGTRG